MAEAALPLTVKVDTTRQIMNLPPKERHAYSVVFAEVTVDPATGEVRARRLLGIFAVGRRHRTLPIRLDRVLEGHPLG